MQQEYPVLKLFVLTQLNVYTLIFCKFSMKHDLQSTGNSLIARIRISATKVRLGY